MLLLHVQYFAETLKWRLAFKYDINVSKKIILLSGCKLKHFQTQLLRYEFNFILSKRIESNGQNEAGWSHYSFHPSCIHVMDIYLLPNGEYWNEIL